jgi:hypothetical protein
VLTESNLGDLQKIKIGHDKLFAIWHLNRIVVKPSWAAFE